MKPVVWNILSVFVLIATCALVGVYISVYANPVSSLNPFPPPTLVPTLLLPSATATQRALPPTWTVTPIGWVAEDHPTLAPSSTGMATATGFVLPSLTFTSTPTETPTSTPTVTDTRVFTATPTKTKTAKPPTKTPVPPTAEPTKVPTEEPTEAPTEVPSEEPPAEPPPAESPVP